MQENGFEYVDLGLPSGTMWATCNIGADKPEDDGLLFQFGRVDGYRYGDENHKFTTAIENKKVSGSIYINPTTSGTEYNEGQKLSLEDDAAHVNMGGNWVMPTLTDLEELYNNTTKQIVTINGKNGMLYTSVINDKSIFIVFAGYWDYYDGQFYYGRSGAYLRSSEVNSSDAIIAWQLDCDSCGYSDIYAYARSFAISVRGVFKK